MESEFGLSHLLPEMVQIAQRHIGFDQDMPSRFEKLLEPSNTFRGPPFRRCPIRLLSKVIA